MLPSIPQIVILFIVVLVLFIVPYLLYGPVAAKAGFSKWWAALMFVPVVNIVLVWVLAYIDWPAETGS